MKDPTAHLYLYKIKAAFFSLLVFLPSWLLLLVLTEGLYCIFTRACAVSRLCPTVHALTHVLCRWGVPAVCFGSGKDVHVEDRVFSVFCAP